MASPKTIRLHNPPIGEPRQCEAMPALRAQCRRALRAASTPWSSERPVHDRQNRAARRHGVRTADKRLVRVRRGQVQFHDGTGWR